MNRQLSTRRLRASRLAAQLLTGKAPGDPVAAVTRVVALQAQAPGPARLAIRPRTRAVTADAVDRACADGRLVRTWAMRGTLHLLAAQDVRWVVGLLGPVFAKAGRRRREQLGLDDASCERAFAALQRVLRGGEPLVRADIVARLRDHGVAIDPKTQAPPHLLAYAANTGLICRGPDTEGAEPTYVLMDDHVPPVRPMAREEALAELARRYLAGHGPACAADFRAWSGLSSGEAKQAFAAIAEETATVTAAGEPMVALVDADLDPPGDERNPVRLLGHFDPFLLGYRDRRLALDSAHAKDVQAGGGFVRPTVVVAGRVMGTWSLRRAGKKAQAVVTPFSTLPRGSREGLQAQAADLARYLGHPVALAVAG
ncbi:Protein of unknown function (DUF1006) [Saccharomonospora marina XMU15]|uniref:Winged helix DNA-binding domain-containing protein n=1 Tax=Saccharomonospora marina XMU15 TaxID=882083 RepID=H5WXU9_9PSEU|nr:winged helix DNA-binding domain-containing protein [Saccharomonospora marina]EHR51758.1 Protein of unknown function (DUF1006) [Saccharomonospora marina XMU15]